MTPTVADTKAITINLDHVSQVNDLLQRVLKGSVNEDQMQAIAIAVGSGQNPSTTALARMIKVAYARDPEGIKKFLTEQVALYDSAQSFVQNVINCDVTPFIPQGWKVVEHQKCGQLEWSKKKFADSKFLHLDLGQQNGKIIGGHVLREALKGKPVMNTCVHDWLLAHPEHIPDSWKDKCICFWGTMYRDAGDVLIVRYLYWSGWRWNSDYHWLDDIWNCYYPALLASTMD